MNDKCPVYSAVYAKIDAYTNRIKTYTHTHEETLTGGENIAHRPNETVDTSRKAI